MRSIRFFIGFLATLALASLVYGAQQHSYTSAEIEAGGRLYDSNCGRCHGENGDTIQGVNFSKGLFKTMRSDEDIVRVIQKGIPSGGMPPSPYSDTQAGTLVAFLRSMTGRSVGATALAAAASGNAERGKALVEGKGNCLSCHRIGSSGGGSGPAIGQLGGPRGPDLAMVERSLLDPSADMAAEYRVYRVVTRSGETIRGTLLNHDRFSVQVRDTDGNLRSLMYADLKDAGFEPSPMPSYKDKFTAQEVADVVAYLVTLR